MRITRDTLMKIVRDTVNQRTKADRGVLSIYLCGSLLENDFLLGGATDIDLIFIHTDVVTTPREIVRLNDEVHLDIGHHLHRDYRQPRALRLHPWMGPTIKTANILFDPQHFLDFTQASVRGQFDRPDFIIERARGLFDQARRQWTQLQLSSLEGPALVSEYLRILADAANSIAVLNGPPLTERRFLTHFLERAEKAGHGGMYAGLLGLLGAPHLEAETLIAWLPLWQAAYKAVPEGSDPLIHAHRLGYYRHGMEALLQGSQPHSALWPLLRTWTLASQFLPTDSESLQHWHSAVRFLGLVDQGFEERMEALDVYLDTVDETLENWAQANGANL